MSSQASVLQQANKKHASSLLRKNVRKFVNNRLAMIGLIFVVLIVFTAVFAPMLTSYDPNKLSLSEKNTAPYMEHLLGTDNLGRDVFARS